MRWGIIICLFLLACAPAPKHLNNIASAPTAAAVYTCTDEGCFEGPPEAYTYIPQREPIKNLNEPNYSRDYNIKPRTPIACQTLGCKTNTRAVGNRDTKEWFPCECEAAHDIPHEEVRCFRDFDEPMELNYQKASACEFTYGDGVVFE